MRLMRSSVFSVRNREFVLAARSIGVPPARILRKHVFPNAMAPLLAARRRSASARWWAWRRC